MVAAFAWLAALLAFGTIGFWIFVVVEFICLMTCMAKESGKWATASLVVTAIVFNWLSGLPVFHWIAQHGVFSLSFLGIYLVAGVVWSMVKWKLHSRNDAEMQATLLQKFKKDYAASGLNESSLKREWENKRASGDDEIGGCERCACHCGDRALALNHKADIMRWMSWWPFSALWFAINDFVMKIFNYLFQSLRTTYQRVSDSSYKDLDLTLGPTTGQSDKVGKE